MFTWIPIYREIAERLLQFESQPGELIALLQRTAEKGYSVLPLLDRDAVGEKISLNVIDPFTFFSAFNRNISDNTRRGIIAALKEEWLLTAPIPDDFSGVPLIPNSNSWFFPFARERNDNDVSNLWRLAKEALADDHGSIDPEIIDTCLRIKTVGLAKLTMGLFWISPYRFPAVDSKTVSFAALYGVTLEGNHARGYAVFIADLTEKLGGDFPQISHDAELESKKPVPSPPSPPTDVHYWTLAAGVAASEWEKWIEEGIIAIDWRGVPDLRDFTSREEIAEKLHELWPGESARINDTLALWEFCHVMKPGDVVFARQGLYRVLGKGRVMGDYHYDAERSTFMHIRRVEWDLVGPWTLSENEKMAQKTLTDITRSPRLVQLLNNLGASVSPERKYWWLNCNPKIWNLSKAAVGETQSYTSHNEQGNKRQVYRNFQEIQEGDLIIGYESTPVLAVVALCRATSKLYDNGDGKGERFDFMKERNALTKVTWSDLKGTPTLADSKPIQQNQGSLFPLTKKEFEIIARMAGLDHPDTTEPPQVFTIDDALKDLFISRDDFSDMVDLLGTKKNMILQGPPGVGKTFVVKRLAYALMETVDSTRVEMVQFHQSYSYEDFVQGYRPRREGGFALKDGVFYTFCRKAAADRERPYVFIIDEINRGNLSKILGELMMLIEGDKRGEEWAIPLTYSEEDDEKFFVPENVHIIGMMNTADRSLAMVDYALRRRFAFVDVVPAIERREFVDFLRARGVSDILAGRIASRIGALNKKICKDAANLGPGFQIGHSYFCAAEGQTLNDVWYRRIIQREVAPLIREYWFDNPTQANSEIEGLLAGIEQ